MKTENQNPSTQSQDPSPCLVYAYTRSQAVADGLQIEVTETAKEAGIKYPVFLTRSVFERFVAVPEGVTGQDEAGRLSVVWLVDTRRSDKTAGGQIGEDQE